MSKIQARETLRQTNAYAMHLGTIFGLYWCIGFACLIAGFHHPLLHLLLIVIVLSTPFVGFALARYFEHQVRADAPVFYSRGYLFSLLMYFFASVVLAIVSYVYFAYFDHGFFIQANIDYLHRPEMAQVLNSPQMAEQTQAILSQTGFKSLDEWFQSITPIMLVASIVDFNIMTSIVFSIPTAFFARTATYIKSDFN
jgi:hypothetical protein